MSSTHQFELSQQPNVALIMPKANETMARAIEIRKQSIGRSFEPGF